MSTIVVDTIEISYELLGEGDPVVITPGGRYGKDVKGVRELAHALVADGHRALIWDRPNTGASGMALAHGFEPQMQADALAGLLRQLDLGPATLVGGSSGARVAMLAAARHPDVVARLAVLWAPSGELFTAMRLALSYYGDAWDAARSGGMQAAVDLANDGPNDWPTRPTDVANRERLLAVDPAEFMATMADWGQQLMLHLGSPVAGMQAGEIAAITAPTLVFNSSPSDLNHPRGTTEQLHRLLADSRLVELPLDPEEWTHRFAEFRDTGQHVFFANWFRLAPQLLRFIEETGPGPASGS